MGSSSQQEGAEEGAEEEDEEEGGLEQGLEEGLEKEWSRSTACGEGLGSTSNEYAPEQQLA
mgnify:CR=1 FL=1